MALQEWQAYRLPRGKDKTSRLEIQHHIYKANIGYLIHPTIHHCLPESACIADVGCGTGIWMRDVILETPSSWTFQGLHLSDEQFSKDKHVTPRIAYGKLDILQDIPPPYVGKFDMVHLSHLMRGLCHDDWVVAAKSARKMLRPGGWIQRLESGSSSTMAVQQVPGCKRDACDQLMAATFKCLREEGKYLPDDVRLLRDRVRETGFEACEEDFVACDCIADTRVAITRVQHDAVVALARRLAQHAAHFGLTAGEVEKYVTQCEHELGSGKQRMGNSLKGWS